MLDITGKKVVVTQIASGNGRKPGQQATLVGLGLNKIGRSCEVTATDSIAGMIDKVSHLVRVDVVGA